MAVRISHNPVLSTQELSDETLMERIKAGSEVAFRLLCDRHAGLFYKVALQYFKGAWEADDAIQEIHFTLWQNREKWVQTEARVTTWLYRLAVNKCIDIYRARKKPLDENAVLSIVSEMSKSDIESAYYSTELSGILLELLEDLPKAQKMALFYHYYEDCDVGEISQRLNTTEQGARSLLKRGKQKLRETAPNHEALSLLA